MPCAFRLDPGVLRPDPNRSCQFIVPEGELIEFDGRMWCRFHLPLSAGEVASAKSGWTGEQIASFNEEVFACIDEARRVDRQADFTGVVFPDEISFVRYQGEADGLPSILLDGATFRGHALFEGVTFGGVAGFAGTTFRAHAWFRYASYGGEARFAAATFCASATFSGATFRDAAEFNEVTFCASADFVAATFHRNAGFTEATFRARAHFESARFHGDADFSVSRAGDREGTSTFYGIDFREAGFKGLARFHNREFLTATSFREACFDRAPEFHGCTLHQDTVFPPPRNFRDHSGGDAARAYRTLKHAMASVHARGEEAKFYALEQKSLQRDKDTPLSTKAFSWLYWLASNYGQSVMRPLAGLLVTFAVFFAIYGFFLMSRLDPMPGLGFLLAHVEDVLRFSLQQVFQPFEVFRARGGSAAPGAILKALPEIPLPLAFLAAVHSVLTLSFLALFLLALRRRFKLD